VHAAPGCFGNPRDSAPFCPASPPTKSSLGCCDSHPHSIASQGLGLLPTVSYHAPVFIYLDLQLRTTSIASPHHEFLSHPRRLSPRLGLLPRGFLVDTGKVSAKDYLNVGLEVLDAPIFVAAFSVHNFLNLNPFLRSPLV
jgi:hypothetical protein